MPLKSPLAPPNFDWAVLILAFAFAVTVLMVGRGPVTVAVLVLVVYYTVVQTPNTTAVTVDQTVEVAQLVVVV